MTEIKFCFICGKQLRMCYPGNDPENGPAEMRCPTVGHPTFEEELMDRGFAKTDERDCDCGWPVGGTPHAPDCASRGLGLTQPKPKRRSKKKGRDEPNCNCGGPQYGTDHAPDCALVLFWEDQERDEKDI